MDTPQDKCPECGHDWEAHSVGSSCIGNRNFCSCTGPTPTNTGLGSSPESPQTDAVTGAVAVGTGESRPDTDTLTKPDSVNTFPEHVNQSDTSGSDWLSEILREAYPDSNNSNDASVIATINAHVLAAIGEDEPIEAPKGVTGETQNWYKAKATHRNELRAEQRAALYAPTQVTGDETQ